jgi:ubiquinone/menaquinone biosynthesis C-methylase UbiE
MNCKEQDYVLGTHDAEIGRLQLQHGVWRQHVQDCWQRSGIIAGMRVVDIGCGPGFASADLAETVGSQGHVIGIERSERFIAFAEHHCRARGAQNVSFVMADVMQDELPITDADAIWCRWLAIFVSDPQLLVSQMAGMLKPGGKLIFHEYVHYETYESIPPSTRIEEFIIHVMRSWRDFGGEPNVARFLPAYLAAAGCRVLETRPISFSAQPHQPVWQWPASFIDVNLQRLLDLGLVDADWVTAVKDDMRRLEANPNALLITPMVLEIIAEKI